ncbi:hypothetical protein Q7P36_001049 [Cladosporium allicinum]
MQLTSTLSYLLYAASIVVAAPVDKRQFGLGGGGSTRNDIKDGKCAPVTLIFARGSTEPGNFGSSVGPSLASALEKSLGADGVAVQGVDYTASIASNAQMGSGGGPVMAELVKQAKANCPDTKIALSGYSQGGFVVSNAIAKQGVNPDDIAAAVVYGDPSRQAAGGLDKSKVKSYCVSGDGVCSGTFAITAAHLAYTSNGDTQEGAAFIVSKTQGGSATSSGSGSAEASGSTTGESSASTSGEASGSASGETSASGSSSTDSSSSGSSDNGSSESSSGGLGGLSSLGGGSSALSGLSGLGGSSGSSSSSDSSGLSGLGGLSSLGGGSSGGSALSGLSSLGGGSGLSSLGGGSSGLGGLSSLGGGGK